MKNLLKNQKGIAHLGLILVLIVAISGIGFAGYSVWQKKQSSASSSSCAGSFVKSVSNKSEKLSLYKVNSKTYCGKLESLGSYKGKKRYMGVTFGAATKAAANKSCGDAREKQASDSGYFSYYAGPVTQKYKYLGKGCSVVAVWGVTYLDSKGKNAADTYIAYDPASGKIFTSKVDKR